MKALLKIAVVFLLWSCAQQAPLTGGDKDTVPPKIIEFKTNPRNLSTNFQSNTVKVEINRLEDLGNNKLITAKMGKFTIKSKVNRETEVPAQNVKLHIPAEKCCVYENDKLI